MTGSKTAPRATRLSVFGLGYVGAVSLAAFAGAGHRVIGVDVNPAKVGAVNRGRSPVIEAGLGELLSEGVESGRISATTDAAEAIDGSDVSLICVGTPAGPNGGLDLTQVEKVSAEIGELLRDRRDYHVVAVRSTMLPGSTEETVVAALESGSGKLAHQDFGVCYNPEFLREGTSIKDFNDPPFTIIGSDDSRASAALHELYAHIDAPVLEVSVRVAEMVKYASNAYHALKVTFANEIGAICKAVGIDSHELMDIFTRDTKLNISTAYLKPGFAFGGSCLPKDLRALVHHARHLDVAIPVVEAIARSNGLQIDRAFDMVREAGSKTVGVLGFSFKAGTDDLRESPTVELIERLIGKGYSVRVYDGNVSLAKLQGANRDFIEREIPHISSLMVDTIDAVLETCDVIVIGNQAPEFRDVAGRLTDGQTVIDLVRITPPPRGAHGAYAGISW
jgi:GDP-mannose 6-dehydrogenase